MRSRQSWRGRGRDGTCLLRTAHDRDVLHGATWLSDATTTVGLQAPYRVPSHPRIVLQIWRVSLSYRLDALRYRTL